MTTKYGKLQKYEKQRLEELIKCRRERERLHIEEHLNTERLKIEKPFTDKIEKLQRESEDIRVLREEAVKKAGYGKIHERGCYDTHPELDAFDKETNKELCKLWERQE